MKIFNTASDMQSFALQLKASGRKIGLVPTMGYLHAGHLSLIDELKGQVDDVIVSIFVNPIQFGVNEDLDKYPRDFQKDCQLCESKGVIAIFAPNPETMYDKNFSTYVNENKLSKKLCGASRPGHFQGVATVVTKLFNITQPSVAIFGEKDAQQALIIRRMVRDLNFPIEIVFAPLIRDNDGVALSSRNRYLSVKERSDAMILSESLFMAKSRIKLEGVAHLDVIVEDAREQISRVATKLDYLEALDADSLDTPNDETTEILIAVAAYFGATRLIDNVLVKV